MTASFAISGTAPGTITLTPVTVEPPPPPPPVPTVTLTANPNSISASGQSSTLSWSSTNATSVVGANFAASGLSGSVVVNPSATTTYSVTATGPGGSATASATVTLAVILLPPPEPVFPVDSQGAPPLWINTGRVWSTGQTLPNHGVVSGTLVIDAGVWTDNGTTYVPPGSMTLEWLVDGVPIGDGYFAGPSSYSWDTTAVPDGTHVIAPRVIDIDSTMFPGAFPYYFQTIPVMVIVANHGAPSSGPQLLPAVPFLGNFRPDSTAPDFVRYPGAPTKQNVHPYPDIMVPGSSDPKLRNHDLWYCCDLLGGRNTEYSGLSYFCTTPLGGVMVRQIDAAHGITITDAYQGVVRHPVRDGGRCDGSMTAYSNAVPTPDGTGFTGVDLDGRVWWLSYTGVVTTIAGTKRDLSVLPYDPGDYTITEDMVRARNLTVGTISGFGDYGGANDLCYDPRNPNILYVAKTLDHCIIKIDLSAGPAATLFAGQDGVPGPATDTTTALCTFNKPFSICMKADGTMYVADAVNNCIRAIDPTGTNITRLVGRSDCPTDMNLVAANTAFYSDPGPAPIPFSAAYMPYPTGIRLDSSENIVLSESVTVSIRVIDTAALTVRGVGRWSDLKGNSGSGGFVSGPNSSPSWFMHDVDTMGTCGPKDDIIVVVGDNAGSAEYGWRFSHDGTYSGQWGGVGWYLPRGNVALGAAAPPGHYPWIITISKTRAALIMLGFGYGGVLYWRPIHVSDPPFDWFNDIGIDRLSWYTGNQIALTGTCSCFAFNSRPAFRSILGGDLAYGHLGSSVVSSFEDLFDLFQNDDAGLAAHIQAGMGGSVPRPEITGNDLIRFMYFIRRNALRGSYPVTIPNPTLLPLGIPPVITSLSAVRNATTPPSMTVTCTTSTPTFAQVGAGSPFQQTGTVGKYHRASPIDGGPGGSTTHTMTVSSLPPATPTHWAVVVKDIVGNVVRSDDAALA